MSEVQANVFVQKRYVLRCSAMLNPYERKDIILRSSAKGREEATLGLAASKHGLDWLQEARARHLCLCGSLLGAGVGGTSLATFSYGEVWRSLSSPLLNRFYSLMDLYCLLGVQCRMLVVPMQNRIF